VFVVLFTLVVIALSLYTLMALLEKRLLHWRNKSGQGQGI
jgi:ABC-type nitrate/sulfonate/bicarbonate transport system permease component